MRDQRRDQRLESLAGSGRQQHPGVARVEPFADEQVEGGVIAQGDADAAGAMHHLQAVAPALEVVALAGPDPPERMLSGVTSE